MSGGPETTTKTSDKTNSTTTGTTSGSTTTNPYGASQPYINQFLGMLGNYQPQSGLSQTENDAYSGLQGASQYGIPQLQDLLGGLLGGFGFGQGTQGINNDYSTAQNALNPYASGQFLNLESNPYTSQIINQVTDSARNSVGDMFAKAGRSFSAGHAGEVASETAKGLASTLFNQFNLQQGNQMNAANSLMNTGLARSQGLDASRLGALGAALSAPGVIGQIGSQMASPYNVMLQQEAARRGIPYEGLSNYSNLLLPIASQFGTTNTAGSLSSNTKGTSSGTATQQTKSDPWQTAIGAGIGLLGLM